jgi:hypothetical protein
VRGVEYLLGIGVADVAEILDALNTSLQNAVDSLAEDAWQFGRGT